MATDAERELAKSFIVRFTKVIESSKKEGWVELHTKARREQLIADDAVETSYQAWSAGTTPVLKNMRKAEFRLQQLPGQLRLTFDAIMVPNDPSAVYQMRLKVEDGELRIDEK